MLEAKEDDPISPAAMPFRDAQVHSDLHTEFANEVELEPDFEMDLFRARLPWPVYPLLNTVQGHTLGGFGILDSTTSRGTGCPDKLSAFVASIRESDDVVMKRKTECLLFQKCAEALDWIGVIPGPNGFGQGASQRLASFASTPYFGHPC